MKIVKEIDICMLILCFFGVLLSSYALLVEIKKEKNKNYTAYCDVNEFISCSKAFSSEYGKGFGIMGLLLGEHSAFNQPNSLWGIFFYLLLAFLCFNERKILILLQMVLCITSTLISVYLAYILYFILQDFCIVCVATYFVNFINLTLCIKKWKIRKNNSRSVLNFNSVPLLNNMKKKKII